MDYSALRTIAYQCLLNVNSEEGFCASSLQENYGCIFGRDSAITILKLLKVPTIATDQQLLSICKKTLFTLVSLQGQRFNTESGEEPGKFIHEYRKNHEKFNAKRQKPWFVGEDGTIRNYDSIDSTPLILIALYKYWEVTQDGKFLLQVLSAVEKGLLWLIKYADRDNDAFIEYELPSTRIHGGLPVQSWTDSRDSLVNSSGAFPLYPIAAIEVQAFAWWAFMQWGEFYAAKNALFSKALFQRAEKLKSHFNTAFIIENEGYFYGVQALDGMKNHIPTITGNPLLCLWASVKHEGKITSIVDEKYIEHFVKRGFQHDLFDMDAGIRTMSTQSLTFNPGDNSYHNGSFWPVLNGLIHEGLELWGFEKEADILKEASLKPIHYFNCPIELYIKGANGELVEYCSSWGKKGCRFQAWTAATILGWTYKGLD